jgi:hypothetical protein
MNVKYLIASLTQAAAINALVEATAGIIFYHKQQQHRQQNLQVRAIAPTAT